jgi:hypothetical protein
MRRREAEQRGNDADGDNAEYAVDEYKNWVRKFVA